MQFQTIDRELNSVIFYSGGGWVLLWCSTMKFSSIICNMVFCFGGMLFASVYGLWLLRNKVVFQNVISDVYGMLSHIRRISWIWLYRVPFSGSGGVVFGNWCICPLDCLRCVC
ncbi:hypothetical protein GLYMA_20G196500v4 [Glycine max]|nr:hypothetical protein GLYMA_20G196500v4 [Glycine max]KAH1036987.1 hypothetical protein GYH30_056412 [Glycine max]